MTAAKQLINVCGKLQAKVPTARKFMSTKAENETWVEDPCTKKFQF